MVKCGECGKELKMINNAHLNFHRMTSAEYDKRNPYSPRYPLDTRRNMGVKTSVNHQLFDEYTFENMWLLGLITADGSVSGKSHPNQIQFYSTEKGLIDEFQRQTNTQAKIAARQGLKGQYGKKVVYQISVNSIDIVEKLKSINAFGNKDQRNPFRYIPEYYKWAFIKGLFDGDGNFYKGMFSIAGRKELINDVYAWICQKLQKEPNKLYKSTGTDKTFYFQTSKTDTRVLFYLMEKNTPETYNSEKYKRMAEEYDVQI